MCLSNVLYTYTKVAQIGAYSSNPTRDYHPSNTRGNMPKIPTTYHGVQVCSVLKASTSVLAIERGGPASRLTTSITYISASRVPLDVDHRNLDHPRRPHIVRTFLYMVFLWCLSLSYDVVGRESSVAISFG